MKIFTLIFSFYLLGLSCLPCADMEECTLKTETCISAANNHNKHNHDAEHCSPFCTCSCCAVSITFQSIAAFKISKNIFLSTKYLMYNVSYNFQVSFSIWQPPKLS